MKTLWEMRWFIAMPFLFLFLAPLLLRVAIWWFDFVLCGSVAHCP